MWTRTARGRRTTRPHQPCPPSTDGRPPRALERAAGVGVVTALVLCSVAGAQRQVLAGLNADVPPDLSTWMHPAAPDGNPFPRSTATQAELDRRNLKILLGKNLFWEEQVSVDNRQSCGTCHAFNKGGTDGRGNALNALGKFGTLGVIPQHRVTGGPVDRIEYGFLAPPSGAIDRGITDRSAPTMVGAYMFEQLFWLRTAGPGLQTSNGSGVSHTNFAQFAALEDLSVVPPVNATEMGHEGMDWSSGFLQAKLGNSMPMALCDPNPAKMPPDFLLARSLGLNYAQIFDLVFSTDPDPILAAGAGVTRERFAAAVAHYMRTLIPDQAPIDLGTMTSHQQRGFATFNNFCASCHSANGTVALTAPGGGFVDPWDAPLSDGLFHFVRTELVKTPTLRNVGLKRHFYSDGQETTFAGVMAFEQVTFNVPGNQIAALQDFVMNALTDPRVAAEVFPFDRPELASERPEHVFEGNEFGAPISGLSTPEIIADALALIPGTGGTSHFRVGVGKCLPNSAAVFGFQVLPSTSFAFMPVTSTNGNGIATTHIDLPPGAASPLAGLTAIGRWWVIDAGAPGGLAQSDSASWTLFQF